MKAAFLLVLIGASLTIEGTSAQDTKGNGANEKEKEYVRSQLKCEPDKMMYTFEAKKGAKIDKITMLHSYCEMKKQGNTDVYKITVAHNKCGAVFEEESEHIVIKNVAQVYFINETTSNELITRAKALNIGLECRFDKNAINTLKGVQKDDPGLIVVGPQFVQVTDYARGVFNGSFRIDFEVFKSLLYNHSYGTQEFPIHVSLKNRIYFQISLDQKDLRVVPQNCYATKTKNYLDTVRHYLIQDRCGKDTTYAQHKQEKNLFRFSVQAFGFKDGQNSIFVHCHTYVCMNQTNPKCRFGCGGGASRGRRSIQEQGEVEGFMTSTLEIKIDEYQNTNKIEGEQKSIKEESSTQILMYLQIPIAILIIAIAVIAWRCVQQRRTATKGQLIINDEFGSSL